MMAEQELKTHLLKSRSDIHWARKIWHMTGVFIIYAIYRLAPTSLVIPFVLVAWVLFVPFDIARHKFPELNQWALKIFGPIMRKNEVDRIAGTTFLLSGVSVVICFFPRQVVSLTLLFLAFADPLASFVGIRFGKHKIFGQKTLEGFLAAFFVCVVVTLALFAATEQVSWPLLALSVGAGFIGAFAELIPVGNLDDNFTMPVLSAIGLYFLFLSCGKI